MVQRDSKATKSDLLTPQSDSNVTSGGQKITVWSLSSFFLLIETEKQFLSLSSQINDCFFQSLQPPSVSTFP